MKQKVKSAQNLPEINLIGRKIGPLSTGEETHVKPWEAAILERHGLIQSMDEYTPAGLRKRVIAEGRSSDLKELPECFYETLNHKIQILWSEDRFDEVKKMREALNSLIDMRVQKITHIATSSVSAKKLPPEEQFLVNHLSELIKNWKKRLDNLFEKIPEEEVGAHEEGIRRAIREIVGDAANIQKQRIPSTDIHS